MIKKLLGILVLGLLWCSVGFADWEKLGINESGQGMYFDPDTLKKHKEHFYVWTMTDYLKSGSSGIYSNKIHMQIDCISKKNKKLTYVFYKDQMAKGEVFSTLEGDGKWSSFASNSVGEKFIDNICK